ncbi:MAG: type II toxin-antitoxin system Phd/YefM family antitoxin [Chloroflexi bacterium]|nr:type II toxin-antitoxin system Phd/YefM family antitoxin [Chloroflexota bacterium]
MGTTRETTYTFARDNFAALWDEVTSSRDAVVIKRKGAEPVALIAADELSSLLETAYLLGSPANARRLLAALQRSETGEATRMTLAQLRVETGFSQEPR